MAIWSGRWSGIWDGLSGGPGTPHEPVYLDGALGVTGNGTGSIGLRGRARIALRAGGDGTLGMDALASGVQPVPLPEGGAFALAARLARESAIRRARRRDDEDVLLMAIF